MKFGKQLVDEAHTAWAEHYIDYKALKQILKQLAPNSRNASQLETNAHLNGLFISSLMLQVQKANRFYRRKAKQLARQLRALAPSIVGPDHWLHQATSSGAGSDSSPDSDAAEDVPSLHFPHDQPSAPLLAFMEMCSEVDALRKFSMLNYLAVVKAIKKHDKVSPLKLRGAATAFVSEQPFYNSTRLLDTYNTMQAMLNEMVGMVSPADAIAKFTCKRCSEPRMCIIVAGSQRYCHRCFALVTGAGDGVPMASEAETIELSNFQVDPLLPQLDVSDGTSGLQVDGPLSDDALLQESAGDNYLSTAEACAPLSASSSPVDALPRETTDAGARAQLAHPATPLAAQGHAQHMHAQQAHAQQAHAQQAALPPWFPPAASAPAADGSCCRRPVTVGASSASENDVLQETDLTRQRLRHHGQSGAVLCSGCGGACQLGCDGAVVAHPADDLNSCSNCANDSGVLEAYTACAAEAHGDSYAARGRTLDEGGSGSSDNFQQIMEGGHLAHGAHSALPAEAYNGDDISARDLAELQKTRRRHYQQLLTREHDMAAPGLIISAGAGPKVMVSSLCAPACAGVLQFGSLRHGQPQHAEADAEAFAASPQPSQLQVEQMLRQQAQARQQHAQQQQPVTMQTMQQSRHALPQQHQQRQQQQLKQQQREQQQQQQQQPLQEGQHEQALTHSQQQQPMPSQSPQRQMQPQPQMQLVQTQRVQTAPHYVTQPVAATLATPLLQHANSPAACSVAALPAFPACPFARGGSVAHNITAAAHSPFCCPPIVTMWPPVASEPVASSDEPKSKKPKKWACKECHKAKAACEGDPCRRCQRLNKPCEPQDRQPARSAS